MWGFRKKKTKEVNSNNSELIEKINLLDKESIERWKRMIDRRRYGK